MSMRDDFGYRFMGNHPDVWLLVAHDMIAAGNLCFRRYARLKRKDQESFGGYHRDISPNSFCMLYAFALEGLLKALWLAQGNVAVKPGTGILDKTFKANGHDLQRWWTLAAMPDPSRDERSVLRVLTACIEIGRYPIRSKAQSDLWPRRLEPHAARALTMQMLDASHSALHARMPKGSVDILPPPLRSLGVRRPRLRWDYLVPGTKTRRKV
jgi:hypothetical protein